LASRVRGFVIGLLLIPALVVGVLSFRPGGIRRQLRLARRRLRIALALAGVYLVSSAAIRILFAGGPVSDYGPPVIALLLAGAYLVLAQDPAPET
jgi:hypothetical protein